MRPFAQHYDTLYADKDYGRDTEILRQLIHTSFRPHILEIGSGTGNHSIRLAEWADVTSVEIDIDFSHIMSKKLAQQSLPVQLWTQPLEMLPLRDYDAAAAFFHVVNYIHKPNKLLDLFRNIARRLKPGAPLLFDMWHGERALEDPPREEVRLKNVGNIAVEQAIVPVLNRELRNTTLQYRVRLDYAGEVNPQVEFEEKIDLHLWQQGEIIAALQEAGFSAISFFDGRNYPQPARPDSWLLWVSAQRE